MELGRNMDYYFLIAQVNLASQIAIMVLLLTSYMLKRKGKFFLHGTLMLVAVILNFVSVLLVMGPSLLSLEPVIAASILGKLPIVVLLHAGFGSVAEVLAVYVVTSWRLRADTSHCVKKKRIMRVTLVLWSVALLFGILVYVLLYTDLLL